MRKLKLHITTSLDSYIAGPNGEIDWLDVEGGLDYGYKGFYGSIDTTLMGNSTYSPTVYRVSLPGKDQLRLHERRALPPDTSHVRFVSGDIAAFVRSLKQEPRISGW